MSDRDLVALTKSLVGVPIQDSESETGSIVAAWLQNQTNATITRDDTGNIIARKGSGKPSLALVGHHDVVDPATSQIRNSRHSVEERQERLYGRGTADMKGALAAMMVAFRDASPERELIFASFVGEERGGIGAQAAIEAGFQPTMAIVGEGSASYSNDGVLDVAIAHKGRRGSTITVSGEGAHASQPNEGENAIYRATEIIDHIRSLEPPSTTIRGNAVEGSVAVTEIDGGTAWNVIPDRCTLTLDERTVPGDRVDLKGLGKAESTAVTVDQDLPPMQCQDETFIEVVLGAVDEAQTESPSTVIKPHATDAGRLADAGTTCLVCGPAEPGEAHTPDESVSLSLLESAFNCYLAIADGWDGV